MADNISPDVLCKLGFLKGHINLCGSSWQNKTVSVGTKVSTSTGTSLFMNCVAYISEIQVAWFKIHSVNPPFIHRHWAEPCSLIVKNVRVRPVPWMQNICGVNEAGFRCQLNFGLIKNILWNSWSTIVLCTTTNVMPLSTYFTCRIIFLALKWKNCKRGGGFLRVEEIGGESLPKVFHCEKNSMIKSSSLPAVLLQTRPIATGQKNHCQNILNQAP